MTLTDFLNHWAITENPFRGEEARDDAVFARMSGTAGVNGSAGTSAPTDGAGGSLVHSDFEKILGDLSRPATSIVFGEKGSGKTAIRLQIAARINRNNLDHPNSRVLLAPHDDLNAFLGRLHERTGGKTPLESLQTMRLVDHIDAILCTIVPRVVDAVLGAGAGDPIELGAEPRKAVKRLDRRSRHELRLLQAVYDRSEQAEVRGIWLRRKLGIWPRPGLMVADVMMIAAPVVLAAAFGWVRFGMPDVAKNSWVTPAFLGLLGAYALFAVKHGVLDRLVRMREAKQLRRQLRVSDRTAASLASTLRRLGRGGGDWTLPTSDSDEPRYAMLARLRRVLACFGYTGLVIVVDRVDEPTLVSGDPDRMRAIVWPMLNNKFLQQDGVGVKLLLPIELRHALFKESSAFFQDARLDKQNFVERLTWTGAMLYDLCDARLKSCRAPAAAPVSLMDLFAEDVTRQDVVDALDQMHQPRDAFKFLYRCLNEHTSNVTRDQNAWKIPKLVLDHARRQEADRVQQLHRGIRPA